MNHVGGDDELAPNKRGRQLIEVERCKERKCRDRAQRRPATMKAAPFHDEGAAGGTAIVRVVAIS